MISRRGSRGDAPGPLVISTNGSPRVDEIQLRTHRRTQLDQVLAMRSTTSKVAPLTTARGLSFFSDSGRLDVMAEVLQERTVLPPEDASELAQFARHLADARARLVDPDGNQIDIPNELYGVVLDLVTALSRGIAVTIAPHNTMLTTQEAADLLNISRPTLVRLLTDGDIPYTMRGRHRRVMLRDILDYRDRTRHGRRQTLDQMTADAEDDGLYNLTATPKRTR